MNLNSIKGNNINLRKAKLSDLESIFNNVWKDKGLLKYTVWRTSGNLEEARDRLLRNIEYQQENPYIYFVTPSNSDEVIGFGGIVELKEGVFSEAGLCIAKDYQNKGNGLELLKILLNLAFIVLNGKEFIYSLYKENVASKALCMHFPFVYKETKEVPNIEGRNLGHLEVYTLSKEDYLNSL